MHIQVLAFVLFFQSFLACQQGPERLQASEASLGFQSEASGQQAAEKTQPVAANIIFQSTDGGQTWQDISAGLPVDLEVNGAFAGDGEIFLGAETGMFRATTTPVLVPVWEEEVFLGEKISSIFPGKSGPYVSSYETGFFQKTPGPGTWTPLANNLTDKRVWSVLETPDGSIFAGCHSGVFKSADAGKNWKQVFNKGFVTNLVEADGVLVGGIDGGLIRSADNGEHWDLVFSEPGSFFKTGHVDGRFVGMTSADAYGMTNWMHASSDGGKTWQNIYENLPPGSVYDLQQAGEYLFCSHKDGLLRSSDRGETWEPVSPSNGKSTFSVVVSGNVIYAIPRRGGC